MNKLIVLPMLAILFTSSCSANMAMAVGTVTKTTTNSVSFTFKQFVGEETFTIKKSKTSDGVIAYASTLKEGSFEVTYSYGLSRELLFTVNAGENISSSGGYVPAGSNVKITIKTIEKCKDGSFSVSVE